MTSVREELARRHAALVREISEHNRRYYELDSPTVTDREYDRLFEELKALERDHPELAGPQSPTRTVGAAPTSGLARVKHPQRMYSLDNSYSEADLCEFLGKVREGAGSGGEKVAFVVEPKLDGASMELIFRGGRLALALTRGDGVEGEDVTQNVRTIRDLPHEIPEAGEVVVRGEVFIDSSALRAINEEREGRGEPPFANPRNAASGSLRLLDPKMAAARPLRLFLYEVVASPAPLATHVASLEYLASLRLPVHGRQRLCGSDEEVIAAIAELGEMRRSLPFEIDGAVVKVDSRDLRERLGFTSRFPRWAIAFKFETEKATTRLVDIAVQVGRTGALTPVAHLEPVPLAGTTVSRATLHNEDEIRAKDVRVGDLVVVEKAGEIIPQIVRVVPEEGRERGPAFAMPETCPVCGAAAVRAEGEAKWRCPNRLACPGQLKASLRHFASRPAMDIEHFGPSLIDALVESGLLADVADIYRLSAEDLARLPRMGEKSAVNAVEAIRASRGRPLHRLITGLGIPLVGEVAAVPIAARYGTLTRLVAADPEAERVELSRIHGIGDKIAASLVEALEDARFVAVLRELVAMGIDPAAEEVAAGPLEGRSFCITGTLSRPRAQVQERIRAAGGEVHSSVKRGTSFLVAGEDVGAAKIEKARALGTEVIDEAALERLLRGEGA